MIFKAIRQVQLHNNPIYSIAQNGEVVFTSSSDGTVKKFNLATMQLEPFTVRTSHSCICLHVLSNGWLCLGLINGDFHVLDPATNQDLFSFSFGERGVFSMDSSNDLGCLFIGLSSGKLAVFRLDTFELLFWDRIANDKIRGVKWSNTLQKICLTSKDGSVSVVNPLNYAIEHSWMGHEMGANAIVCLNDGRVITGGKDGYIRVWGNDEWRLEHAFPAHRGVVYSMVVIGDYLFSASRDKSIKVWSLVDYSPLQKLTAHRQSVNALVQQNEHSFVSVSDDGTLIFWNNA
ncbi:MAG: WD40 repeat domain-containing protein [Bacteroidota bacterium]